MPDNDIVILSAVRTAQGKFQGGFAGTPATDLGAVVMKEALKRAGVAGDQLDEVIFGNVIQAGLGQNVARQARYRLLAQAARDESADTLLTAHTLDPVPLIVVADGVRGLASGGKLADVAPTLLDLIGVQKPPQWTGRSLLLY